MNNNSNVLKYILYITFCEGAFFLTRLWKALLNGIESFKLEEQPEKEEGGGGGGGFVTLIITLLTLSLTEPRHQQI